MRLASYLSSNPYVVEKKENDPFMLEIVGLLEGFMRAAKDLGIIDSLSSLKRNNNYIDLYPLQTKETLKGTYPADMPKPLFDDTIMNFIDSSIYACLPLYESQLVRFNKDLYAHVTFNVVNDIIKKGIEAGKIDAELDDAVDLAIHVVVTTFSFSHNNHVWMFDQAFGSYVGFKKDGDHVKLTVFIEPEYVFGPDFVIKELHARREEMKKLYFSEDIIFLITALILLTILNLLKFPIQIDKHLN